MMPLEPSAVWLRVRCDRARSIYDIGRALTTSRAIFRLQTFGQAYSRLQVFAKADVAKNVREWHSVLSWSSFRRAYLGAGTMAPSSYVSRGGI